MFKTAPLIECGFFILILNGLYFQGLSDAHYGHPRNLIKRGRGINMGDGWETARRKDRPPVLKVGFYSF